jgi:hypothetical protein
MSPHVKDWVEVAFWAATIIGGGITAWRAISEVAENRQQRVAELRWRRANTAKQLLDDIHHHLLASQAVAVLDFIEGSRVYKLSDGTVETIDLSQSAFGLGEEPGAVTDCL